MKKIHFIFCIVFLFQIFSMLDENLLYAQSFQKNDMRNKGNRVSIPNLFFYKIFAIPTESPDTVQCILYTKIAKDFLRFVVKDTTFIAQYELTIMIKNDKGESLAGKIQKGQISKERSLLSNPNEQFTKEKFIFFLPPGEYNLYLELLDLETKVPYRKNEKITLPDFYSQIFTPTDLLFFQSQSDDSTTLDKTFPYFPPIRSVSDTSFWAKFYIFSNVYPQKISIKRTISNAANVPMYLDSLELNLNSRIQAIGVKLNQELTFGQYYLVLEITDGKTKREIKSPFFVQWEGHSHSILSLKETVETLSYIMDRKQWNQLKDAPQEEQEKLIEKFWQERDPDPGTETNELEQEYFRRIIVANQNFALRSSRQNGMNGWKTDRGRIYIIYGQPTNIERSNTEPNVHSVYEIWYYGNLNKKFIFEDAYNSGNFRLISEE